MKSLITCLLIGLVSAAVIGCEASARVEGDDDNDGGSRSVTKTESVDRDDDGDKTVKKTTTIDKD